MAIPQGQQIHPFMQLTSNHFKFISFIHSLSNPLISLLHFFVFFFFQNFLKYYLVYHKMYFEVYLKGHFSCFQ